MTRHPIRTWLFVVIALVPTLCWTASSAFAQSGALELDIPPQELSSALKIFAEQTNLQLLYASEVVEGRRTTGLLGTFTTEEALTMLLANTGLTYTFTDANTVTLQPPARRRADTDATGSTSKGTDQHPVKLPEIIVKEVRQRDDATTYVAEAASTA